MGLCKQDGADYAASLIAMTKQQEATHNIRV